MREGSNMEMSLQAIFLLVVLFAVSCDGKGYCTTRKKCNGKPMSKKSCNRNKSSCLSCNKKAHWCPSGYCNWNSCDGEVQGGKHCNKHQANCEKCGTDDPKYQPQWCRSKKKKNDPGDTGGENKQEGYATWWTDSYGAVQGGSCEYASPTSTAQGRSWLSPYITPGMHCAVSDDLFSEGAGCGKCYHIEWDGIGGTDPGKAGSAVVQVTNSGAGGEKHFDCFDDAFKAVTGTNTGIFPLKYYEVACKISPVSVVVLDGNNAWYTKVLVAGGKSAAVAVRMTVGSSSFAMYRNSGATWAAGNLGGASGTAEFDITFDDGSTVQVKGCFNGKWPVSTSSICS